MTFTRGRTVRLMIAASLLGTMSTSKAWSEEVFVPVSPETFFPETSSTVPTLDGKDLVLPEKSPASEEETDLFEAPSWPFHLPEGKEVALHRLENRFDLGKWGLGAVTHPQASFSLQTGSDFRQSLGRGGVLPLETEPVTQGEKIAYGFQLAEMVATPIPLLGGIVSGLLGAGKDIQRLNRKMQERYHIHLDYSDSTYRAVYKERF